MDAFVIFSHGMIISITNSIAIDVGITIAIAIANTIAIVIQCPLYNPFPFFIFYFLIA